MIVQTEWYPIPVYQCNTCGIIFADGKELRTPVDSKPVSPDLPPKNNRSFDRHEEVGETGILLFGDKIYHYCKGPSTGKNGLGVLVGTRKIIAHRETA